MSNNEKNQNGNKGFTRRTFLKNSGMTVGGVVLGGAIGSLFGGKSETPQSTSHNMAPALSVNPSEALMFFTPDQYRLTQAAADRIYPTDENGPGAMELNAAIYIDHQLASPWGFNVKEYMSAPFYKAEETQGSQVRILRKDLFLLGLSALDAYSNNKYKMKFSELTTEEQDLVLTDFSEGIAPDISTVSSKIFFNLLRTLTIEGVYADPLYGGNKDMIGWSMRKYPGSRMNYVEEIQDQKFVKLEPQGLNSHMGH